MPVVLSSVPCGARLGQLSSSPQRIPCWPSRPPRWPSRLPRWQPPCRFCLAPPRSPLRGCPLPPRRPWSPSLRSSVWLGWCSPQRCAPWRRRPGRRSASLLLLSLRVASRSGYPTLLAFALDSKRCLPPQSANPSFFGRPGGRRGAPPSPSSPPTPPLQFALWSPREQSPRDSHPKRRRLRQLVLPQHPAAGEPPPSLNASQTWSPAAGAKGCRRHPSCLSCALSPQDPPVPASCLGRESHFLFGIVG